MVHFQSVYVGKPNAVVGVVGDFYGPAGRTEREAQARLLEYMQSDVGMKHYQEVYPDTDEAAYQQVLFQLYELEDEETCRKSSSEQPQSCVYEGDPIEVQIKIDDTQRNS